MFSGWEGTLKTLTDAALVFFTAVLAWATIKLARHTKTLSKLTDRLVKIETQRDERDLREKERRDLEMALQAAEGLQQIYPETFAQRLNNPADLPLAEMKDIETLHSLKRYIKDSKCDPDPHLEFLCSAFDSVRREKSTVRVNEQDVVSKVRTLQGQIQWFVDRARAEISSGN